MVSRRTSRSQKISSNASANANDIFTENDYRSIKGVSRKNLALMKELNQAQNEETVIFRFALPEKCAKLRNQAMSSAKRGLVIGSSGEVSREQTGLVGESDSADTSPTSTIPEQVQRHLDSIPTGPRRKIDHSRYKQSDRVVSGNKPPLYPKVRSCDNTPNQGFFGRFFSFVKGVVRQIASIAEKLVRASLTFLWEIEGGHISRSNSFEVMDLI